MPRSVARNSGVGSLTLSFASEWTSDLMDLLELFKRPEGKTLEFKRDLSTAEGAFRTIVAFANTAGGALGLGVEDWPKRCATAWTPPTADS
jgi:hypothetical protein